MPGLNAVIKSVVYRATEAGYDVLGIRRGWEGLTHVRPGSDVDADYLRPLDRTNTRTIDRTGGTVLHTSRTNPRKMRANRLPAWLDEAVRGRYAKGDGIVRPDPARPRQPRGARHRRADHDRRRRHALVLAGPRQRGRGRWSRSPRRWTTTSRGRSTASGSRRRSLAPRKLINRQRTTLGSHERIGVFRIFGRDAGFSALYTAYVTSGRCVIPEVPYDLEALAEILADDHRANPSHYAFVITAEGAIWHGARMADVGEADAFGHRHKADVGEALAAELKSRTGIETVASELTYDLRSGEPDSLDSMVATTFANVAMDIVRPGWSDGWSPSRTASTPTRRCPIRTSGPARWTCPDVQRGAVPAALRREARRSDAARSGLD